MDYAIYLNTRRSPPEVERVVTQAVEQAARRGALTAPAEPVCVSAAIPSTREMIKEGYGFEPDIVVSVQLDKFVDDVRQRDAQAVAVIAALLREEPGDLYTDFFDGHPVLLRRAGLVHLDERWAASRPWAADAFPRPDRVMAHATTLNGG